MANICMYKIKVLGKKAACYALINMMPSYSYEKEILREEGDDENYELVFLGDCKWSVHSYTSRHSGLIPYTDEQISAVEDGFGWEYPIDEKALLLGVEVFCNSKDIDDCCYAEYEHYNKGVIVRDECPQELHIKRGRDYDQGDDIVIPLTAITGIYGRTCKVKFETGAYTYAGNYELGDIVYVSGAKRGQIGRVIEINENAAIGGLYQIEKKVGHVDEFKEDEIELIWKSYKPADRKVYLKRIGLEENTPKKKYLSAMNHRWTVFGEINSNWEDFKNSIK